MRRVLTVVAVAGVLIAQLAPPARAAVISVTTTADEYGTGTACSLREAIRTSNREVDFGGCDGATGPDVIQLPAGTFTLARTGTAEDSAVSGDLDVARQVTIQGAGTSQTVIDGNGGVTAERVFHIVAQAFATISGVTITGGRAGSLNGGGVFVGSGSRLDLGSSTVRDNTAQNGGGLNTNSGTLHVSGGSVTGNAATVDGGGINSVYGTVSVTGSTLTSNTAGDAGGGLDADGGTTSISTSTFSGNESTKGGGVENGTGGMLTLSNSTVTSNRARDAGGGVWNNAAATISGSTISGNRAAQDGGGVSSRGTSSTMSVTSSTISGNAAFDEGGGVFSSAGGLTVELTAIRDNVSESDDGGGIYRVGSGPVTVRDSVVSGNTAPDAGGALFAAASTTVTVRGSTLASNRAGTGGGVANHGGAMTLANSTLSGNTARLVGGAVRALSGSTLLANTTVTANTTETQNGGGMWRGTEGTLTVRNSIVAANRDLVSPYRPDCAGTVASEGYNVIGDRTGCVFSPAGPGDRSGTATAPLDPRLGPLADNGGPTPTHALLTGSPAIDAGNPAVPGSGGTACEPTDQRGVARPQRAACDAGSFELV